MKRWLIGLVAACLVHSVHAFDLDKKMFLSQHFLSYTTSFDVANEDRKLGTLYRRVLSLNTVYDFYDFQNKLLATAESHFFSFGATLDVFDANKVQLGTVEEKVFSFFPSFDVYSPDGGRLARATMNFWGTTFTLYDGMGEHVLAEMSRDFFRLTNNWTIEIKDLDRVKERNIDSRLLLTVLAIQGDLEYLEHYRRQQYNDQRLQSIMGASKHTVNAKLSNFLKNEAALADVTLLDEKSLDALAAQLDQDFQKQYAGTELSPTEKMDQFVNYCLNMAGASDTAPETQKAIVYLLQKRVAEQSAH